MRLILLDSDINYLKRFQLVVSNYFNMQLELYVFSSLEELKFQNNSLLTQSIIVVHEEFIYETLNFYEEHLPKLKADIFVLCEGLVEQKLLTYLCEHPLINYLADNICIPKYQPVNTLIDSIKDNYLLGTNKEKIVVEKKAKLISVYTPINCHNSSSILERTVSKFNDIGKTLIINIDPYYGLEKVETNDNMVNHRFNLSYLFTMIKRRKTNMNLLISEMVIKRNNQTHIIMGPMNMLDIDCLTVEETQFLINFFKSKTDYSNIVFNICGVHVTEFIHRIFEECEERILISKEEKVQMHVGRQFQLSWIFADLQGADVLKEVIL